MTNKRYEMSQKLNKIYKEVFEALEIDVLYENHKYISCCTEYCHDGDSQALVYYYDTDFPNWICFTHHCEEEYGRDLVGLIMATKKINEEKAIKIAQNIINGRNIKVENKKDKKDKKQLTEIDAWTQHISQKTYDDKVLKKLGNPLVFCKQREMDFSIVRKIGCGIANSGKMQGRFVVPIRNIEEKIVGFSGRIIGQGKPKWLHDTFSSKINLFGVDLAKDYISQSGEVILVEGPIDVIKLNMAGFYNSCCIFGSSISNEQIDILLNIGVINVKIATDQDEAGTKAANTIARKCDSKLLNTKILEWSKYNDFGEMPIEKIKEVIE